MTGIGSLGSAMLTFFERFTLIPRAHRAFAEPKAWDAVSGGLGVVITFAVCRLWGWV